MIGEEEEGELVDPSVEVEFVEGAVAEAALEESGAVDDEDDAGDEESEEDEAGSEDDKEDGAEVALAGVIVSEASEDVTVMVDEADV